MSTIKYKGFIGSVEFSHEDKVFYGKIEGINSLVNYEGTSVAELNSAFEEAVNDYIAHCKENNLPLHKSYTGNFNIRIPADLHARLAEKSLKAGMSLNAFIKETLQKAIM
ncbi:MAG TPA: type II toxin-antitoxin system HicB family antitoxin [Salinivirgaceae bacterium]|nr:type II toxin-antitoxin system HicB family antitoxin [Salinivirgaceae bacterium]HQA76210.1 type II toxin-antitoxin system HicB family antitoxin [Salinivirgaceae bacterium]